MVKLFISFTASFLLLSCDGGQRRVGLYEDQNGYTFDPLLTKEGASLRVDKIFVINLDKSKDRLEKISRQLNDRGLEFERFPAVYGKLLSEEDLKPIYHPNREYFTGELSRGEIGNYLSHYGVMREIIQKRYDVSLVLEDDVELHPNNFKGRIDSIISHAPKDWDIIYLGCHAHEESYSLDETRYGSSGAEPKGCHYSRLEMASEGRMSKVDKHCVAGNYGYLVSLKGASKLLMHMLPIQMPTDYTWKDLFVSGKFGEFAAYCANPELVIANYDIENTINENGVWRGYIGK